MSDPETYRPYSHLTDEHREIIIEMGVAHGMNELSSVTTSKLSDATSLSSLKVGALLRQLESDGVVEQTNPESSNRARWRLAGADSVAPYRTNGDADE